MSTFGSGHNGGPPLDPPVRPECGRCKNCIHWHAPSDNEQRAYEMFRLGLSRKRVKRPSGTCDRVLLAGRSSTVFSATAAEFGCLNYEAKPRPPRPVGGGFVTIWRNGRIAWQGPEEKTPSRYLQETLDLDDGDTPETGEDEARAWRSHGWRPASRTADRGREGMRFHDGLGSRERLSAPVVE